MEPTADETLDVLMRGRVKLIQRRRGYRTSVDAMLLAWFAASMAPSAERGRSGHIIDLGAGSGLVSILLAMRFPDVFTTLVEMQSGLLNRARRNLALNGLIGRDDRGDSACVHRHDLADGAPPIQPAPLVVSNPPFFQVAGRIAPADDERRAAHYESTATITAFASAASRCVTQAGVCCWVYPADSSRRLIDGLIEAGLGAVAVTPVEHRAGGERINRVLVAARPSSSTAITETDAVSLHPAEGDDSVYTPAIEAFIAALKTPAVRDPVAHSR